MSLDWSRERYVRLYTRDTPTWDMADWTEHALLAAVMRKLDRSGRMDLGKFGTRSLSATTKIPLEVVEKALPFWLEAGTLVMQGTVLFMPNFVEAQECAAAGALRTQLYRERVKLSKEAVTPGDDASQFVTLGNESSPYVTNGDAQSRAVTSCDSVPCRAVPSRTVPNPDPPLPPAAAPEGANGSEPAKSSPAVADVPSGVHRSAADRRGTRAPVSTSPDAETFCQRWGLPPPSDSECASFLDYWGARTGQGATKLDWTATWRNRPRKDAARASPVSANGPRGPQQPVGGYKLPDGVNF